MKKINLKDKTYNDLKEILGENFDKTIFDMLKCLLIENDKLSNKVLELLNKICEVEKNKIKEEKFVFVVKGKDDK